MSSTDLQNPSKGLSGPVRASLEGAFALAVRNARDSIELHHGLGAPVTDRGFCELRDDVGVSPKNFAIEIDREPNTLTRGRGGTPFFTRSGVTLACAASSTGSRNRVAFADLLRSLADDTTLRSEPRSHAPSLRQVDGRALAAQRQRLAETAVALGTASAAQPRSAAMVAASATRASFVALHPQDMTADAEADRIDPVVGRKDELRQVVDILPRCRQNNPIAAKTWSERKRHIERDAAPTRRFQPVKLGRPDQETAHAHAVRCGRPPGRDVHACLRF